MPEVESFPDSAPPLACDAPLPAAPGNSTRSDTAADFDEASAAELLGLQAQAQAALAALASLQDNMPADLGRCDA